MAEPARQALSSPDAVAYRSDRFGDYELPADRVLLFPEGLIGFPDARRLALLEPGRAASPFRCLVCLDAPELGFVVCDPTGLWPGYAAELPLPEELRLEDIAVLAIVTVPADPREMTANLMAPLIIDCRSRTGRQIVLDTGRYSTRHHLLAPPATNVT
jgi:flagellar assembly factor FliW